MPRPRLYRLLLDGEAVGLLRATSAPAAVRVHLARLRRRLGRHSFAGQDWTRALLARLGRHLAAQLWAG
jgi:hypothetical protein